MQHSQMESLGAGRERYEQNGEVERPLQKMFYRNRIDRGGKILPALEQRKKAIRHLRLRLFLALFSTLVFLLVVGGILTNAGSGYPDLTNVDLLLALVSYGGVNALANLLLDRAPGNIDHSKSITNRVIFAIISFLLAPTLCWMMVQGANGIDGILLVLVSTVVTNGLFYLTLCKKRDFLERPATLRAI